MTKKPFEGFVYNPLKKDQEGRSPATLLCAEFKKCCDLWPHAKLKYPLTTPSVRRVTEKIMWWLCLPGFPCTKDQGVQNKQSYQILNL